MKKTIIFDIDGTLANLDHRLHFVNGHKKDWKQFLALVSDDLPIDQTIFLNRLLKFHSSTTPQDNMDIVLSSGRSEDERADTEAWMAKYGVYYDKLYMRPSGDFRADYVVKREMLDQMRADGREPWLVFDDRQSVVDMWRNEGLFVLQCAAKETFLDVHNFHKYIEFPLTIMVGPSGAGKSTHIESMIRWNAATHDSVISSDSLRQQICGDFRDQTQNLRVFEAMNSLAAERLKHGLPVILDATHVRRADRVKSVSLLPSHLPVRYVVIDRPLEEKIKTEGWRKGVELKGTSLVRHHHEVMKNNLKMILDGDGFENVTVQDKRVK